MKTLYRILQYYLIIGLPIILIFIFSANTVPGKFIGHFINDINNEVSETFSVGFILWFVFLFVFLISLIISPSARTNTLKKLANLKDRDEREEYITGKASSSAYIATLSMMIFLLFLSVSRFWVEKLPVENTFENHRYVLKMDFHYDVNQRQHNNAPNTIILFDSRNIFPSPTSIILLLMGWQLLVFNIAARRNEANDI